MKTVTAMRDGVHVHTIVSKDVKKRVEALARKLKTNKANAYDTLLRRGLRNLR